MTVTTERCIECGHQGNVAANCNLWACQKCTRIQLNKGHLEPEYRYSKCCQACEHGYHDMPLTEDEMLGALLCDCACHDGVALDELKEFVDGLRDALEPKGWTIDGPIYADER